MEAALAASCLQTPDFAALLFQFLGNGNPPPPSSGPFVHRWPWLSVLSPASLVCLRPWDCAATSGRGRRPVEDELTDSKGPESWRLTLWDVLVALCTPPKNPHKSKQEACAPGTSQPELWKESLAKQRRAGPQTRSCWRRVGPRGGKGRPGQSQGRGTEVAVAPCGPGPVEPPEAGGGQGGTHPAPAGVALCLAWVWTSGLQNCERGSFRGVKPLDVW